MNQSALIIGIISVVVLLLAIFGLRLYLRIKRSFAVFPVTINYVRRDQSPQTPFLYVELELKNISGKSIFVSEVQQLHLKGPFVMFVLQDAQGRTKLSPFEIRQHFPKKVEIKDGCSFYRYYRIDLQPSIMNTRLYLRYRIVTTSHLPVASNAMWVVPSELEQMPFKPRKGTSVDNFLSFTPKNTLYRVFFLSFAFTSLLGPTFTTTALQPVYLPDDLCIPVCSDFHSSLCFRLRFVAVGE